MNVYNLEGHTMRLLDRTVKVKWVVLACAGIASVGFLLGLPLVCSAALAVGVAVLLPFRPE